MLALVFSHPIGVLRRLKKVMGGLPPGSLMSPCLPLQACTTCSLTTCSLPSFKSHRAVPAPDAARSRPRCCNPWRFSRRSSACPRKSTAAIHPPTTHPMRKPSYAINCLLYTSDDRVHGSGVGKPWAWVESASSIIEASTPFCISCCRHARAMEATRETIDSGASEAVPASAVLATDQGGARSHGSLTVPHGLLLREKDGTELSRSSVRR
jgi:hypothetical protein